VNRSLSIATSHVRIERAIDPCHRISHAISFGVFDRSKDVNGLIVDGFQPSPNQRPTGIRGLAGNLGERFQTFSE